MERVRKLSEGYPLLKYIESQTSGQVRAEYFFLGVVAVLFAFLFLRAVAAPIANLAGVLFIVGPATAAIVGKNPTELGMMKHIISYLLTFALATCLDSMVPMMHRRIPFFYHLKLLLFYYLSVRKTQFTEYLNTSLYASLHDAIRGVNSLDTKDKIKAAQNAANERVREITETMKDSRPLKDE